MIGVYDKVPTFESQKWLLRKTNIEDAKDLFEVYSDTKALPFFNSDNCNGDNFYYDTLEKMEKAIDFWDYSYQGKWFVRWSIIDRSNQKAVGTIELFCRHSSDCFNDLGILRLDLKSSYELEDVITEILSLIIGKSYEMFDVKNIATKAVDCATQRIKALRKIGFMPTTEHLVGNDATEYDSYYIR